MDGAVVCLAARLARLWGRGAVGEGHAVGGAVGLAVIAVLVVDHVLLWLAALDLSITNKKKHNAVTHLIQTTAAKKGCRQQDPSEQRPDYLMVVKIISPDFPVL